MRLLAIGQAASPLSRVRVPWAHAPWQAANVSSLLGKVRLSMRGHSYRGPPISLFGMAVFHLKRILWGGAIKIGDAMDLKLIPLFHLNLCLEHHKDVSPMALWEEIT